MCWSPIHFSETIRQHGLLQNCITICLYFVVGGYASLEFTGVYPDCISELSTQPSVDSSAYLAHSHISTKGISPLACHISSGRIH